MSPTVAECYDSISVANESDRLMALGWTIVLDLSKPGQCFINAIIKLHGRTKKETACIRKHPCFTAWMARVGATPHPPTPSPSPAFCCGGSKQDYGESTDHPTTACNHSVDC
ncbi:hypothetical protein CRENBAI_022347 [Crenichthys baileyi]|uniref:Uncharacterized protein n=1 Tax=Crenichthys baileyi TaxID=28760 RepID=A0AAV9RLX0_9TELE